MLPAYPTDDFNAGHKLLSQLGSFWSRIFADREVVATLLRASAWQAAQTHLNFLEASAALSRFDVPVFHTQYWHLLVISQAQARATPSRYGEGGLVYGAQDGTVEGRPEGFIQTYGGQDRADRLAVDLPPDLVDLPFTLQNLVVHPSRVYVKGLDYDIVEGRLVFLGDPFADPLLPQRTVYNDKGEAVDREIALWAYKGQFDLDAVYAHFGYVLGVRLKSSDGYKALLNAYWDLHLRGPNVRDLVAFLAALAGVDLVREATETVEVVRSEADSTLIVTDAHVYRLPLAATPTVTVGEVLHAGDFLSDAVRLVELGPDRLPGAKILPALAVSERFLNGGYVGELVFRNGLVALEYLGADADGKSIVRFDVGGLPGDVEAFWAALHQEGARRGAHLAELLDQRENPLDQPGPLALPTHINPLHFVLEHIFANHLFLIRLKPAAFGTVPGLQLFGLLRDVIPPHTTYVVYSELTPTEEVIDLGQDGNENAPGVQASATTFKGFSPLVETLYPSEDNPGGAVATYGTVHVSAKLVSLTCP